MWRTGAIIIMLSPAFWAPNFTETPAPAIKPTISVPARTSPAPRPVNPLPKPALPSVKPANKTESESRNPYMPDKPSEKKYTWDTETA